MPVSKIHAIKPLLARAIDSQLDSTIAHLKSYGYQTYRLTIADCRNHLTAMR